MSMGDEQERYYAALPAQEEGRRLAGKAAATVSAAPVGYSVHANAMVLPLRCDGKGYEQGRLSVGGVCDENGRLIAGLLHRRDPHEPADFECWRAYRPRRVLHSSESVIFGGVICGQFGMFLTYSLMRLWYVLQHADDDLRVAFVLWADVDLRQRWHMAWLELAGIERRRVMLVRIPMQFRSVIVPEQSLYMHDDRDRVRPAAFLAPFEAMARHAPPQARRRIYLSRSRYQARDVFNEEYFEHFFAARGFDIIYPEQLSPAEQVGTLAAAVEIACTFGTLSHLAVFAPAHTRLTVLMRAPQVSNNPHQSLYNQLRHLRYTAVDVSLNLLPTTHDCYCGYLLGPTEHWHDYVRDEYGAGVSACGCAALGQLGIGAYLKFYLQEIRDRTKFLNIYGYTMDYAAFHSTLCLTFRPQAEQDALARAMVAAMVQCPELAGGTFRLRSVVDGDEARLRLAADGAVELLRPPCRERLTQRLCRWSWARRRLYMLEADGRVAAEFSVTATGDGGEILMLSGCLTFNRACWLQLFPVTEGGE